MTGWLKNLLKDSLVYGIGFGISRFLQIIVLPIIAHALSLAEFGYYSNYVIFYSIAGGVFVLGMDSSVARFMFDSEDKNYHRKLFSISFFCLLIISLLFASVCSLFPSYLLKIINVPEGYKQALPYVLFIIPCMVMNNFFLTWFKWKRQKFYFLVNIIGTVFFLLMPLLLAGKISFIYIFQTIFFGQLVVVIISTTLASGYIRFVFDGRLLGALLKYGFPWMLVYFLGLSRTYLDRFFLTHYLNEDSYGVYNFSIRLATFLALITTAFDMSFGPLAYSIWKKEDAPAFFARIQSAYTFMISAAACMIVIVSPLLVNMLGGEKYNDAEKILPYLLFSAIPLSLINFSSLGITYSKKSFLSTVTLVIGFTVVLFLNAILTPKYLQFGAVNASLIGHMFIVISGYYFSQRYYKVNFHFVKDGLIFLFFLGLSIAFAQFQFSSGLYQDIVLKILVLITIMFLVLVVFFQTEVRKTISFLNNIRYPRLRNNAVTNV
jgi:O-antigen/teichoic acid export membrane protein